MTRGTRHFGLPGVPLHAGDHICVFHTGKRERDDILIPFLREGVQVGDKCLVVLDEHDAASVRDGVLESTAGTALIDQLEIKTLADRARGADSEFSPDDLIDFWESRVAPGFEREHYDFLRFGGEAGWWLPQVSTDELTRYESHLNRFMDVRPQVALCLYDSESFGPEVIVDMVRTHPRLLVRGAVIENPYYLTPDRFVEARYSDESASASPAEIIDWYQTAERAAG